MPNIPFFHKEKSLSELQEEDDKLNTEYTIEQKKAAIRELKKRGIDPSQFNWSISSIINWLKHH
jgi:hypothetical protein